MHDDPDRLACLPLAQLDRLLYRNAVEQSSLKVFFNHKVVELGQDSEKAWVEVETPEGSKRLEATYIVGCDGANSIVRRKLYGDWVFPGYTWDKQIVATNVRISLLCWSVNLIMYRSHILLRNSATTMPTSSFILNTGIW